MADGIVLYPPGGHAVGAVRVRDRMRPLRPVRAIVDEAIASGAVLLRDQTVGRLGGLIPVEGEPAAPPGVRPLMTRTGLAGDVYSISGRIGAGPRRHHDLAVLVDPRFVYLVRLESDEERVTLHRQAHLALVDSIVPLPAA